MEGGDFPEGEPPSRIIQAIKTKGQNVRFFVYIPMPLAAALGVEGGEEVSWELLSRSELHLVRSAPPPVKARKQK